MNNTTFGDEGCGYYETVAGGAGAVSRVLYFFIHSFIYLFIYSSFTPGDEQRVMKE